LDHGIKSRESIYGASVRASEERAAEARRKADQLACEAWNKRMMAFQGPAQPSPTLGDALNASYLYLEVKCLGCDTHQTVALDIVRRRKTTPITVGCFSGLTNITASNRATNLLLSRLTLSHDPITYLLEFAKTKSNSNRDGTGREMLSRLRSRRWPDHS
jgi:hypothetical protein